jgi:hypothetical protein
MVRPKEMADAEHLSILKRGVTVWNEWRNSERAIRPDLSKADLEGIDLQGIDLRAANLQNANLTRVNLSWSHLILTNLRSATLTSAKLIRTQLVRTDLEGAILTGANLRDAFLVAARVYGADFTDAVFGETVLATLDLSSCKGLHKCRHIVPSTLGHDSLILSAANIPETFLRGIGVPEPFISNAKSLVAAMTPIQFYSCFISYSTQDQDFADRLYADLQAKGVRCWFAPHDVKGGRKLHEQIDEAIRLHDKLLLILSPHSMRSEWVMTEISRARKREMRDGARVLFPISLAPFEAIRDWECFDADTGKDSAREIREYHIPDFSNWKHHDEYGNAFKRLLSDLRASSSKGAA